MLDAWGFNLASVPSEEIGWRYVILSFQSLNHLRL